MRNKLTVPWLSRVASAPLFRWWSKGGQKASGKNVLKEQDLDHLGALHSASTHSNKKLRR